MPRGSHGQASCSVHGACASATTCRPRAPSRAKQPLAVVRIFGSMRPPTRVVGAGPTVSGCSGLAPSTAIVEPAAAEQKHDEDDDEERVCRHCMEPQQSSCRALRPQQCTAELRSSKVGQVRPRSCCKRSSRDVCPIHPRFIFGVTDLRLKRDQAPAELWSTRGFSAVFTDARVRSRELRSTQPGRSRAATRAIRLLLLQSAWRARRARDRDRRARARAIGRDAAESLHRR